jgi:hypothetical protein
MVPSNALVIAANAALTDANFRDTVKEMHAQHYSLVKMVEALGLEADLTDPIRAILQNLPDSAVDGIRDATLKMLEGPEFTMPLDCAVTDAELEAGVPVDVHVDDHGGVATIHVRAQTPP